MNTLQALPWKVETGFAPFCSIFRAMHSGPELAKNGTTIYSLNMDMLYMYIGFFLGQGTHFRG